MHIPEPIMSGRRPSYGRDLQYLALWVGTDEKVWQLHKSGRAVLRDIGRDILDLSRHFVRTVHHRIEDSNVADLFVGCIVCVHVAISRLLKEDGRIGLLLSRTILTKLVVNVIFGDVLLVADAIVEVDETCGSGIDSLVEGFGLGGVRGVWQNEQIHILIKLVLGLHGIVQGSVLSRNDVAVPQVNIVVFQMGSESHITAFLRLVDAIIERWRHRRNELAPCSFREVKINLVLLRQVCRLHGCLKCIAD